MIQLKPFSVEDWKYIDEWISNEAELIQFAGQIFSFPIDEHQINDYLSDTKKRTVFRIDNENNEPIGMAEISDEGENVAKIARVLIGEKSMRGKGIGTVLIKKLTNYGFDILKKDSIRLNVYKWNIDAIKCYKKVGFLQTDKQIRIINVGNEEWENIEMVKYKPTSSFT